MWSEVFAADGADEEGTLQRLKALRRELLDAKIVEHHGHIVKTIGDGMVVEFPSVVDAVCCRRGTVLRAAAEMRDDFVFAGRRSPQSAASRRWLQLQRCQRRSSGV
jgi:class 3 adenylate cyclase